MHRLVRTFGLVCAGLFLALPATAQDLVITGVVDGPLPQGTPKAAEIYVINTIADLSTCGIGSASNGGGSDGQELTFSGSATAGDFLYVASEQPQFNAFFGFDPDFTGIALSVNGDDAIELFCGGSVIDTFGELTHSGPGAWNYQDGWAYRTSTTGADGSTFTIGNWTFSGANALDGESDNATATTPFPIGTYQRISGLAELLISEVVVTPTAGEYIEIYNPGSSAVDLTDVYLTDATFAGSPSTFYYNIVTGTNAGGGSFSDFHARFPNGASIAAGEYQTVSLNGSANFFATYGINPTYELYEDGTSADAIPDMLEATSGSINDQGGLTNSGEVAILYYWDGTSDLVQDLDYVVWGDKAEGVDKTGVSVDGPDADSTPSTFLDDTAIASQDVVSTGAHSSGNSFQRSDLAEGTETQTGGNGVQGDDETSENLSVTFTSSVAATPNAGNVVDNPPAVTAVNPADAATNVPVDTNVEITFSEGVTVTGTWFTISCTTSSDVTPANSAVTGGPVTYTIDPNTDFDGSDACTLTVFAAQVADTDGTPDNPTADFTSTFNTPAPPATLTIAEIQGAGNDSPQAGNTVTTSGNVVTAVVSNGFYMQSQPGNEDADPLTSEGIFVFTDGAPSVVEANVVTVTGTIEEFFSSTQFDDAGLSVQVTASEGILPAPIDLNTNTPSTTASVVPWFERYEGMLVTVANALVNAPTDRFGDTFLTVESTLRLREEGIEFPGQASLPVWDGNPELFEIDPNGVDQADVSFNVGGTVSATG
ncbi:MAG: lamin tail domain-containing protein, partial [Bacteroidota bacterium]